MIRFAVPRRALPALCWLAVAQSAAAQLPEIAIDRATAGQLGAAVGDTVALRATPDGTAAPAVITAIIAPPTDPATLMRRDRQARLHLPDLAAILGYPDRVDRFGVVLRTGVSPAAVSAAVNARAFGYHATPAAETAAESSRTFQVVERFHRAIAIIATAASTIFLLSIMLLKTDQRRLDIAMLRFIGIRRRTITAAIILETTGVAVFGSIVGLVLAILGAALTNSIFQRLYQTELRFAVLTPDIVVTAFTIAIPLGIAAGAAAAMRLAAADPLVLWRRG